MNSKVLESAAPRKPPNAGKGRVKGVQNKLTRSVKDAFEAAFHALQKDPKGKLSAWAKANPTDFYKLASKLIPHDLQVSGRLTLEQLLQESAKK